MGEASGKKKIEAFRIAILCVLLLLSYVANTTPFIFFQAASPDFLLVFAVVTAMFETPLKAGIFGFAAGLFKDISCASIFGFHGFIYLVTAVTVSVLIALLIRRTFINALVVNAAAILGIKSFYYFIYNVLFEKGGRIALFYRSVLPSVLLTLIIVPITYFILRYINRRFGVID